MLFAGAQGEGEQPARGGERAGDRLLSVDGVNTRRMRKAELVAPGGPLAARADFERELVVARAVARAGEVAWARSAPPADEARPPERA